MCGSWFSRGTKAPEVTSPLERAPREPAAPPRVTSSLHPSPRHGKLSDGRACASCFNVGGAPGTPVLLAVPCGHVFCEACVWKRCSLGLTDRRLVPAHCCGLEFPSEYVEKALGAAGFQTYSRYVRERHWKSTTLRSDVEYAAMVKRDGGMQCPSCGVGVKKISGCQGVKCLCGHQFLYMS
ncbi:hypothetical protein PHYPSEUDO_008993 [Phytophthora pseudosyringae]|uniref:Zinc finger RING-type eukaryotic domain-containing protein n=1 Tax=Phytophthora pseudosyringae TaxID=221518 RepID=A0A8T1W9U1_9STRA|nr:hypothetical protein PHYPSEUDO_008993 [Phytophthora pseudosyringae]